MYIYIYVYVIGPEPGAKNGVEVLVVQRPALSLFLRMPSQNDKMCSSCSGVKDCFRSCLLPFLAGCSSTRCPDRPLDTTRCPFM